MYLNQPVDQKQAESKLKTLIGELGTLSVALKKSADNLTDAAGDLAETVRKDNEADPDYDNLPEDPVSPLSTGSAILRAHASRADRTRSSSSTMSFAPCSTSFTRSRFVAKLSVTHDSASLKASRLCVGETGDDLAPRLTSTPRLQADIFDVYEKRTAEPLAKRAKMTSRQRFLQDDIYTGFRALIFVRHFLLPEFRTELSLARFVTIGGHVQRTSSTQHEEAHPRRLVDRRAARRRLSLTSPHSQRLTMRRIRTTSSRLALKRPTTSVRSRSNFSWMRIARQSEFSASPLGSRCSLPCSTEQNVRTTSVGSISASTWRGDPKAAP